MASDPLPAASPKQEGRWAKRLDFALAATTVAFAFLVSSFPVRNSDFWQHLAAGRLLARGEYTFGVDPFSCTSEGVYWANHAWLFDLCLYLLYQAVGGSGLVVLKALLVAALAGIMLCIRRANGPGWVAPACTALALLAASPRLLLQPVCVSFFLLGLTLWLLWRGRIRGWRSLLVPLICALWVNLDAWFFLGPLLVALFWLGGRLSPWASAAEADARIPGWLVLASIAGCLCSPHHLRAFVLPVELSFDPAVIELRHDPRFRPLFASLWQTGVHFHPTTSVNLSAWAYFVLVAVSLLSFVLARGDAPAWRLLVWVVFGLLGAWQARLVPFFAVVAGPITALNFFSLPDKETRRQRDKETRPVGLLVSLSPCLLVFLSCLALIVLAWPGWLQGFLLSERHAGWGVEPNASLLRSVETLQAWRRTGRLARGERVLAVHPDVAHYWAWFCPEEKGFLDHRFTLFGAVAADYEAISRALLGGRSDQDTSPASTFNLQASSSKGSWRQTLRDQHIGHAVLYDPNWRRLASALRGLYGQRGEWELCSVDGQALLLRWNDPNAGPPANTDQLDPDHRAFAWIDEEDSALPPAPGAGPTHAPEARKWWSAFVQSTRPPAWESAAAAVYLHLFDDQVPIAEQQMRVKLWSRLATGTVGMAAQPSCPVPARVEALAGLYAPAAFVALSDRPSPALPLLAIRAARRALAREPSDASAWLVLGRAYLTLGAATGEAELGGPHALLARLRHVQAATALHRALLLKPDLESAHAALADLYVRREYLDAALSHRQAQLHLSGRGTAAGEDLENAVAELEKLVQDRQQQFVVETGQPGASNDPLERALLAVRLGLPVKALEILERSQVVLFGTAGARLELELMLMLGRAAGAREMLHDAEMRAQGNKLGVFDWPIFDPSGQVHVYRLPAYEWLCLWEAAANGDYDRAAELLSGVAERLRGEEVRIDLPRLRSTLAQVVVAEIGARPQPGLVGIVLGSVRRDTASLYSRASLLPDERADLEAVAGVLALERGLPRLAERHLRRAEDLSANFVARPLAGAYLRRIKKVSGPFSKKGS